MVPFQYFYEVPYTWMIYNMYFMFYSDKMNMFFNVLA